MRNNKIRGDGEAPGHLEHHNLPGPFAGDGGALAQPFQPIRRICQIAENVHLFAGLIINGADFHAGDHIHPIAFADHFAAYGTCKAVMVSNGDGVNAAFLGNDD